MSKVNTDVHYIRNMQSKKIYVSFKKRQKNARCRNIRRPLKPKLKDLIQ